MASTMAGSNAPVAFAMANILDLPPELLLQIAKCMHLLGRLLHTITKWISR